MARIPQGSFAEVIHAYLASDKFEALQPGTKDYYRRYLRIAEDTIGDIPVGEMRPAIVRHFLSGFAKRPGAQTAAKVAIKAVEAWGLEWDHLPYAISTAIKLPASKGGHKPWTEEQVDCAIEHSSPAVRQIIQLASNTGQRGSDLIRMRWKDIELVDGIEGIKVTTQKVGLKLWIPFSQELKDAMATWDRSGIFILTKPNGLPYPERRELWAAWVKERDGNAELKPCAGLVLHGLRATAVVRLRRAGATTPQIVDMVGLSAPMVERYSRFASQKQSAAAAVILLDRTRQERKVEKAPSKRPASD